MLELLIILVMGLAIASAAAMLLTSNAVHSALFLIVTMLCIAFLFLTLNAPFLAMIQITVYAGAIMVLFLFVIMLLGAQSLEPQAQEEVVDRRYRWFLPLATGLGFGFIVMLGIVMFGARPLDEELPAQPAQLRVINAAPEAGAFEVHTVEGVIVEPTEFRAASDYIELPPGETRLMVHFEATDIMQDLTAALAPGSASSLIVYGLGAQPQIAVVTDDLGTVTEDDSSRVVVFNAYSEPISIVDYRSEFDENDTVVIIPEIASGAASEAFYVPEGLVNWSFTPASDQDENQRLFRMNEYEFSRDTSDLVIFLGEPTLSGANTVIAAGTFPVSVEARPAFGGPRAIGYLLFTDFMLPFQLLGLLLLAAMVGAIVLTHREIERAKGRGVGQRRVVSRPLVSVIAAQVGHEVVTTAEDTPALPEKMGE